MKAIYNSRITEEENIQIKTDNRGFCYGDGLFETIVTGPERINLLSKHIDRLKRHASILSIDISAITCKTLITEIKELTQVNGLVNDCRTKVFIWRKTGGLYAPESNDFNYIITQNASEKKLINGSNKIGFSQKIRNHFSIHSCIKSLNALDYVIAGKELIDSEFDELIILDHQGNISETHIGNLFWVTDGQLFTPSLATGCIDGVMRNFIIDFFATQGNAVIEVEDSTQVLQNADAIFSTNASGITYFKYLQGRKSQLSNVDSYLKNLIIRLQQP